MRKSRLKVGLDYDDVLAYCNQYIVDEFNDMHPEREPMMLEDIKGWTTGSDDFSKFRNACYESPDFVASQPLYEGAKEFIKKLSEMAEVFIVSAVPLQCMSARGLRIALDFPEIEPSHVILGASKDLYQLDVVLDDGSHNITRSIAKYPVLMRRPWNSNLSGVLAVNAYNDFLHIIELICESYAQTPNVSKGGVICLVGPSGAGKTAVTSYLTNNDSRFIKPLTTTTRPQRPGEPEDSYNYVSEEEFIEMKNADEFLESTVYSGYYYGTKLDAFDDIIAEGKYGIIPIDICGAISIKNKYRAKAILLFIQRDKEDVIFEIIDRNVSSKEKTKRILSLDKEYENEVFCDETIDNNGSIEDMAKKIKRICKIKNRAAR